MSIRLGDCKNRNTIKKSPDMRGAGDKDRDDQGTGKQFWCCSLACKEHVVTRNCCWSHCRRQKVGTSIMAADNGATEELSIGILGGGGYEVGLSSKNEAVMVLS